MLFSARSVCAFTVCCAMVWQACAKVPVTRVQDLVRESDLVVLGVVERLDAIEPTVVDGVIYRIAAQVRVEHCLAGCSGMQRVAVAQGTGISEVPAFAPEIGYVLFLRRFGVLWIGVRGHLGAIAVENGVVNTWEINGQPQKQNVEEFVRSILAVAKAAVAKPERSRDAGETVQYGSE